MTNQKSTIRLAATLSARRRKVLPEEGVVDVSTAVEVEQGSNSGSLGEVSLALSLGDSLEGGVEAGHVGLVVLLVVKLHDLSGDVRLERAIVVYRSTCQCQLSLKQRKVKLDMLTLQVGKGRLAAHEAGAGGSGSGPKSSSAESSTQRGSGAKKGGRHRGIGFGALESADWGLW